MTIEGTPAPDPTPPTPNFQPITVKVDGKDVRIESQAQLLEFASKGADYTRKTTALAEERRQLEAAAKLHTAFQKYRETESLDDLRAFYEAGGYPEDEIEAMLASVEDTSMTTPPNTPPNTPTPDRGGGGSEIDELKARLEELTDLVAGREGLTIDRTTESVLDSDDSVKKALEGLDEGEANDRRSWLLEQATSAARAYIRDGRSKGRRYSPTDEREIAKKAVESTVALIKRIKLDKSVPSVGPTPAMVQGDPTTAMAEPRLPSSDPRKLGTKDIRDWMTSHVAKRIHDQRRSEF